MTKIDIVSGFLGAGKTTLIKKLLGEALNGTKVVLIENEFGQIGIDGGFLKDSGIEIKEMNSGCICCSLVGDFGTSLQEVLSTYEPERILIEPSGVGKLSDVMKAVENVKTDVEVQLNSAVAVVDASKCKMYIKNFGEFFVNQIQYAGTIILSRTGDMSQEKIEQVVALIREYNKEATIITTPWDELDGKKILETIEDQKKLESELMAEVMKLRDEHHHHHHHDDDDDEHEHHHHHHHDDDDDDECCCHDHDHDHHHHDDDDDEQEHHHHHHDHDEHDHEHHHDHDEHCSCGCHDHGHEGHHHADEVFDSYGYETPVKYTKAEIEGFLEALEDDDKYGMVLRAKGMVPAEDGTWIYFDYVPGESNVRAGAPDVTGKFCVIGASLKIDALNALFEK
ncbi:MAG: cobalamin biosynthesis protein CobW [Lachnospiraceae bacterium]|nr:cobalamin biosynthesis protein CobW [Lachnospiraceae bacterium]